MARNLRFDIRQAHRARREKLSKQERLDMDSARTQFLLRAIGEAKTAAVYLSAAPEPDTFGFLNDWQHPVLVPKLLGFPRSQPHWAWLYPDHDLASQLTTGMNAIPDPNAPAVSFEILASVDAIIIPALAADQFGNRLGTGGGWFDRTLPDFVNARRICLLYSNEILDEIPSEPHDQPVDVVVSETGIRYLR